MLRNTLVSLSLVLSCAKPLVPTPAYAPKLTEPDWIKVTEEATVTLQSLIQIPSVNPPTA